MLSVATTPLRNKLTKTFLRQYLKIQFVRSCAVIVRLKYRYKRMPGILAPALELAVKS